MSDFEFAKKGSSGLDFGFAHALPTGLSFSSHNHTLQQLSDIYHVLLGMSSYSKWGIGDLIREGMDVHGEDFSQLLDAVRIKTSTAQKYAWVCARFSGEFRSWRKPETELSFSHYELLAGLLADQQEESTSFAFSLLERCVRERLSCEDVETEIKAFRGDPYAAEEEIADNVSFSTRAPVERLESMLDALQSLLEDAPPEWDQELPLLRNAVAEMDRALNSIRNRSVGGLPDVGLGG